MKKGELRLNPFIFISETDIRFYFIVIIGIIFPITWALKFFSSYYSVLGGSFSFLIELLIFAPIILLLLLFIYWNYRNFPKKIIKKFELKIFGEKKSVELCKYVENLYKKYLPNVTKPTLMYERPKNNQKFADAFTFGTKKNLFINMTGGLIAEFTNNIDNFTSIFLHELGHIANKDVEKTYLAQSTWQSLLFALSIPFSIIILLILAADLIDLFSFIVNQKLAESSSGFIIGNLLVVGITLYFLIFMIIIFVLRNQIIRQREFYADAKVLEWKESPNEIVKTLEEKRYGEPKSQLQLLAKFHPNINERIQVLKNNSVLFIPSLWIAFAIGYFYYGIEENFIELKTTMFSGPFSIPADYEMGFRIFLTVIIFTLLMLAISSSFHKLISLDIFYNKSKYFSITTLLNIVKFSLAFSLGTVMPDATFYIPIYLVGGPNISILKSANLPTTIQGELFINANFGIFQLVCFLISLTFLSIFATLLIRRSFSRKEAMKNFLIVSILSSILYVINWFVAVETLHNNSLLLVFFFGFSIVTYILIKLKDRKLYCPYCGEKLFNLKELELGCPKCNNNLYTWAIYSFL